MGTCRLAAALILSLLLARGASAATESVSPPPGPRPIPVQIGFYLLNLVSVDERSETFDADFYINCTWHDPRLAFRPESPEHDTRMYQGDAASSRLQEIWWPDLEFVNTSTPEITNRLLTVRSDGTVEYRIGLSSSFRADLDLRRFPFDQQDLEVEIQSFDADQRLVVFTVDPDRGGFDPRDDYAGLDIKDVRARTHVVDIEGWNEDFSELVIGIHVVRSPSFYLWTVFVPVSLVLLLSCTIFFVDIESFHDRIAISLACFLACIATQFAMSFNLPKISYLTPIDRLFLVAYSCMTLGVAVSVVQVARLEHNPGLLRRTDLLASLGIPILYAMLIVFVVLP